MHRPSNQQPATPDIPAVPAVSADLVVLGGGPAGLAAAWWAARAGREVVLLERGERPGGLAGSFEVGGVRVDFGSHRLHPSTDPTILAELTGLLGDDLQRRPRNGRIRLAGRWIRYPLRPGDLVRRLPPSFAAGVARDTLTGPLRRRRASGPSPETFASVLRAGLGPTMSERFYFPYARKLWGLAPEAIDAEQARRRVSAATPGRLLARVARGLRREPACFWYPRTGFGAIAEALADAATAAGAELRLGHAVTRLELAGPGGGAVAVLADGATVQAPLAFSTVPLPVLARLAGGPAEAAAGLSTRGMVLVYLVLDRRPWTSFDAHYLPEPSTPVSRVSEPANYRDGDDPAKTTVLCAELPCTPGDELWSSSDAELGELVADGLARCGLPAPDPVAVEVRRLPSVYPVYRTGWRPAFEALDAWAGAQPALVTFGRQGLFAHDNTHHTLAMARAAVDALGDGGSFDRAAWARARDRFTTHVVED